MSEEILVNVSPTETRVAVIEGGQLQEVWMERAGQDSYVGHIYRGTVARVLPGMQAAFIDIGQERTAFLHASDLERSPAGADPGEEGAALVTPPIEQRLREQAEVVVQVIRDPIGGKGARLTMSPSIASRFLVLLPGAGTVAVSSRIEEGPERERLVAEVEALRDSEAGEGFIIRTNAEGMDAEAFAADMRYLRATWDDILARQHSGKQCIYAAPALPLRVLRDRLHAGIERVRIDDQASCEAAEAFVGRFLPHWSGRVEPYQSDRPLFDLHGVEDEIERALKRRSDLKSGGYLVIDQTEAMTTIDVNTGAFVGRRTQEETVFKTNLEAAQAIARQLRLRNLGGIIIIDFIDMSEPAHRDQVLRTLETALARDPARTRVFEFSALGLVEMTRKRTTGSLGQALCEPCPACTGSGLVKSVATVCLEIIREIMRSGRQFEASRLLVMASPAVVDQLLDEHSATIAELEGQLGRTIQLQRESQFMQEQFDVVLL
ncbi:MAG: ribonuclease G [Xanthomonadales bacterium]|nr:ribonuclease G [Xanthomonadales bacterium]